MRHRMTEGVCLFANGQDLLSNQYTDNPAFNEVIDQILPDAYDKYFEKYSYLDFDCQISEDGFIFQIGVEPAYKYDHYDVITFVSKKESCYREHGIAWGYWGTGIASTTKVYGDYKKKCKFTRFIDEWQPKLAEAMNKGGHE